MYQSVFPDIILTLESVIRSVIAMQTRAGELVGVEFPIWACGHRRDLAAAVSNAGLLRILGAVAHGTECLESHLTRIEQRTGGKPYGVESIEIRELLIRCGTTASSAQADSAEPLDTLPQTGLVNNVQPAVADGQVLEGVAE